MEGGSGYVGTPMLINSAISHKNAWGKGSSTKEERLVQKEKIQVANTLTGSCSGAVAGQVLYTLNLPQHISKSTCSHKSESRPLNTDRTKRTRLEVLLKQAMARNIEINPGSAPLYSHGEPYCNFKR